MTADERAKLRALCDAATPGREWKVWGKTNQGEGNHGIHIATIVGDGTVFRVATVDGFDRREEDAAFIAASRQALPAALDRIEELEREREKAMHTMFDLAAENERLRKCLTRANAGMEEYERRYYFAMDELEHARKENAK